MCLDESESVDGVQRYSVGLCICVSTQACIFNFAFELGVALYQKS